MITSIADATGPALLIRSRLRERMSHSARSQRRDATSRNTHKRACGTDAFSIIAIVGLALLTHGGAIAAENDQPQGVAERRASAPASAIAGILVQFKLDPALTRSMYMGERWVSRETYTSTRQIGEQAVVRARAVGVDHRRKVLDKWLDARWRSEAPDMLTITPTESREVLIIVHRAGESRVHVSSDALSQTLTVRAAYRDGMTQVEISQAASEATWSVDQFDKREGSAGYPTL